jgi:tripartite-type tricarboxylate transporter receptor subunit TctC
MEEMTMNPITLRALGGLSWFAAACCASAPAAAAEEAAAYPSHAVHMLVPYTPGGAADVLGRALGAELSRRWRQPVIIDNRPGADGGIAMDYLAKSPADGYTLMYGPNALYAIYPYVHPKAPSSARNDLIPVAMVGVSPLALAVTASLPAHSVPELIAYARAHPGDVSYGSPGNSSLHHMAGEQFALQADVKMTHVPYKGTSQATTDLAGGQLKAIYGVPISLVPMAQTGKIRILAVTSATRSPLMPDTPSVAETLKGWPDYSTFQGVFVVKGTPDPIVRKIEGTIADIMKEPQFQQQLVKYGFAAEYADEQAFRTRLENNYEAVGAVIRKIGMVGED